MFTVIGLAMVALYAPLGAQAMKSTESAAAVESNVQSKSRARRMHQRTLTHVQATAVRQAKSERRSRMDREDKAELATKQAAVIAQREQSQINKAKRDENRGQRRCIGRKRRRNREAQTFEFYKLNSKAQRVVLTIDDIDDRVVILYTEDRVVVTPTVKDLTGLLYYNTAAEDLMKKLQATLSLEGSAIDFAVGPGGLKGGDVVICTPTDGKSNEELKQELETALEGSATVEVEAWSEQHYVTGKGCSMNSWLDLDHDEKSITISTQKCKGCLFNEEKPTESPILTGGGKLQFSFDGKDDAARDFLLCLKQCKSWKYEATIHSTKLRLELAEWPTSSD